MAELIWYELYFPGGVNVDSLTNFLRPLAHRPKLGWRQLTPAVAFELRADHKGARWLMGIDQRVAYHLARQLHAQLPDLVMVRRRSRDWTVPLLASNVQPVGLSQPLRVEMAANVTAGLLEVASALRPGESATIQWVVGPAQPRRNRPADFNLARSLGLLALREQQPLDQRHWRQRTIEPLFAVRARIGARAATSEQAGAIVAMLGQALRLANATHTELQVTRPTVRIAHQLHLVTTAHMRWAGILNAAELAAVLGWPVDGAATLLRPRRHHPAPVGVLQSSTPPSSLRIVGTSVHPADGGRLVAMPIESALHHLHIVGPTGSGKSTLLAKLVRADIAAGHSVLVIEPRGDLIEDILAGVPEHRHGDVVLIEPGAGQEVVGINPLAGPLGSAERRADQLLHLFHELYGNSLGPRSSDVLLHSLIALTRSHDGTLADLPVLLTNAAFRRQLLATVGDQLVLGPFFAWFDGLSEAERHLVITPVLNKTRAFLSRTAIRQLVGQPSPRFRLDDLFNQRRIVLANLNTGIIGSETAQLIGALLLTQLWQAMQRRARQRLARRHPVMVVVDEVQNYLRLPVDLGDLFAQARGLGVSLTVAHQHLSQLPPKLRAAIVANARSRIAFRPSADDRTLLASVLGGGVAAHDLELLGAFEAYVRLLIDHHPSDPFIVRTSGLAPPLSDPTALRQTSHRHFGANGPLVDDRLRQRWHGDDRVPPGPVGQRPRRTA